MTKYRADMTVLEKFRWHAEVYALRRVTQHVSPDERTSPADPQGTWFNETMVDQAERELREKGRNRSQSYRERKPYDELQAPARARILEDEWSQQRGYADVDAYEAAERIDHSEACRRIVDSFAKAATLRNHDTFNEPPETDRAKALRDLGVSATERTYTKEELRQARIQLGLEPPDPPPNADEAAA